MSEKEASRLKALDACVERFGDNQQMDIYNAERTRRALARYNNPTLETTAKPKPDPKRIEAQLAVKDKRGRKTDIENFAKKVLKVYRISDLSKKTGISIGKITELFQELNKPSNKETS